MYLLGGAYHAAVAGGYSTTEGMMFSVELMDLSAAPEERKWVSGPNMPWELAEFPMVTSPSGNGVLTVGGVSGYCQLYRNFFVIPDLILE